MLNTVTLLIWKMGVCIVLGLGTACDRYLIIICQHLNVKEEILWWKGIKGTGGEYKGLCGGG